MKKHKKIKDSDMGSFIFHCIKNRLYDIICNIIKILGVIRSMEKTIKQISIVLSIFIIFISISVSAVYATEREIDLKTILERLDEQTQLQFNKYMENLSRQSFTGVVTVLDVKLDWMEDVYILYTEELPDIKIFTSDESLALKANKNEMYKISGTIITQDGYISLQVESLERQRGSKLLREMDDDFLLEKVQTPVQQISPNMPNPILMMALVLGCSFLVGATIFGVIFIKHKKSSTSEKADEKDE